MSSPPHLREQLTKRIRSGGAASSSPHPDTEGDDLLLTPLENKLDKILRAPQKRAGGKEWVDVSDKTTAPTKKGVKFKERRVEKSGGSWCIKRRWQVYGGQSGQ